MKKLFLFLTVLVFSLKVSAQTAPCFIGPCPPTMGSYPGACFGGVDRYLARSIMMTNLPQQKWWGSPADYCANINMLADINASYISRVVGLWGDEQYMIVGSTYYNLALDVIADINNTYSCANLRRPILEGAVLEWITSNVNAVVIPPYVLNEFQYDPDFFSVYGYTTTGTFSFLNTDMVFPSTNTPDISKLPTRMWFYYLATQYITMGCQGIHMGNIGAYSLPSNDPGHVYFIDVVDRIRAFAALTPMSFVYINVDVSEEIYRPSTNQLVLDFICHPIRPDETYNFTSYNGLPCQSSFGNHNTELNFHEFGDTRTLLNLKGGIAPNGCSITRTPVLFNVDWWGGGAATTWTPTHNGWNPWSTDEMSLFNSLTDDCQAYWLESFACAIKNDVMSQSYLKIPGVEPNWDPITNNWLPEYHLIHHPAVRNTVRDRIWHVNDRTNFTITESCEFNCDGRKCQEDPRMSTGTKKYILQVTNPDCSSVYTWHVYRPSNNTWLPYTYGKERELIGLPADLYQITLRQDNFGFPYPQDVFQMTKDWNINSNNCCVDVPSGGASGRNVFISDDEYSKKPQATTPGTGNKIPEQTTVKSIDASIYPNPATNEVSIELQLDNSSEVDIVLSSVQGVEVAVFEQGIVCPKGKTVLKKKLNNILPGTYLVTIKTSGATIVKKLTIL